METNRVFLRPLQPDDFDALLLQAQEPEMWKYFTVNLADPEVLRKWITVCLAEKDAGTRRPFTIIDKESGLVAGSMSMLNISYYDKRLEIGSSWIGKDFRSTGINLHAKYMLLKFSFEEAQMERVEFKTDEENDRARKGLLKIGGREEGILRSHMTMWNDRRRSSVFYSVLKAEWPALLQTVYKKIES
jgi:RimJ/RimL family protein N-acetyltransferase